MAHSLAPLPYDDAALEPHIDTQTMQIHHGKHHQAYVTNLNAALDKHPALHGHGLDDLLRNLATVPEDIRTAVRNNGGGHWNHTFFWNLMAPNAGGAPTGALGEAITASFGSFDAFKEKFAAAGHSGCRRVGARLLPQVPEPPRRLPRRLLERRQLAGRRRPPGLGASCADLMACRGHAGLRRC